MIENKRRAFKELKARLNLSNRAMAQLLAEHIGGNKAISGGYISKMCNGKKPVSEKIYRAIRQISGSDIMVRPAPGVQLSPGCKIQKAERVCKRPGCGVRFIPEGKADYCSDLCRKIRRGDQGGNNAKQ